MPLNADLLAACLAPISPDQPAGADLRYDTRLDPIKEARREELLPGTDFKLADWAAVIAQCSALLQKETKDLQLAAWLTEALVRRNGVPGLLTGVSITRGLLEGFWDTIYPLPEDDDLELRAGPLEWVGTKLALPLRLSPIFGRFSCADLDTARTVPDESKAQQDNEARTAREAAIADGKPTPEEVAQDQEALNKGQLRSLIADIDATVAELQALERFCDERMGRDAPTFGPLRSALDEPRRILTSLLARVLETDPDPIDEPTAEDGAGEGDAGEGDGTLPTEPTSAADAGRRIGTIARWLRQEQRANPAAYRLLRGYRWGELLTDTPVLNERLLEAPPTAIRSRLRALLLDGKWPELLEQGESLMATTAGRGWLDLQRYAWTAATNLGGEYAAVATAIRAELRTLLATFPQLPRLMLMDETPTANDETRAWIADEVLADPAQVAAEPTDEADALPSDGTELVADAIVEDHRTAEQGGLARTRGRHPAAAGADPFVQALAEHRAGRPQRAIELLTAELQRERSPRGRFLRQTQIAFVMVEAGLHAVAHPILQQLVERIDERKLDEWESGPLVAQPLALMHRVLVARNEDSSEQERLYLRICRLDPIQALGLRS
ncbi:MAG: type VI secretion system protein TssA [Gemmatimonadaceae bacterium]|nr:type VI secretion system protein TssA [Gemmatimonadaceae bacterium]